MKETNIEAKIFVVTSGKGGVGKTTTTANIGAALALAGYNVCLIDADIGLKNLDLVLGIENRVVYTLLHVARGEKKAMEAVVKHKHIKNLSLLSAPQTANKDMISEDDMIRIVDELSKYFHFIIIDSPAGIEAGFKNAIAAAKHALIVTTPELTAISDADRVIGLLENRGYTDKNMSLIVNRIKPKMVQANEMMSAEDIKNALAIDLIGIIPDSEEVILSTNVGNPIVMDESKKLATVYRNVSRRIIGEHIPVDEDLKSSQVQDDGFFSFFKKLRRKG